MDYYLQAYESVVYQGSKVPHRSRLQSNFGNRPWESLLPVSVEYVFSRVVGVIACIKDKETTQITFEKRIIALLKEDWRE